MTAPQQDPPAVRPEAPSTRAELRHEISRLAQRKLAAANRIVVRRWAADITRTDEELAERYARLLTLTDLPETGKRAHR